MSARSYNASQAYAGSISPIRMRNEANARRARLSPLRKSDEKAGRFANSTRICTLQQLVDNDEVVDRLCGNGESHLLVADEFNPGEYSAKAMYDYAATPTSDGLYFCDVHQGSVLLHPDTLIYWK